MPYICLARADIPDGVLQILDLAPNSSQSIPSLMASGETRYVNRAKSVAGFVSSVGKLNPVHLDGLSAYLVDRVEVGGLEQGSGTITAASPVHGDTVTIGGVVFTATENYATATITCGAVVEDVTVVLNGLTYTAKNAPVGASQFQATNGGISTPAQIATSLAASITSRQGAAGAAQQIVSAPVPGAAVVTVTALVRGLAGQYTLVGGANAVVSGNLVAAVPTAATQQFAGIGQAVGGTNGAVIASLGAAINDNASIAALKADNGNVYVSSAAPVGALTTITAKYNSGADARDVFGFLGNLVLATSSAHMTLSGSRMSRTHETWTRAVQAATAAAIMARVDAGSALALADINTVLSAQAGANLVTTGAGASIDSRSTGVVADILAICAGRAYRINRASLVGTAYQFMNATNPTFQWNAAAPASRAAGNWQTGVQTYGAFTTPVKVNGNVMSYGEIKASTVGGVTENREVAGIRHTYNADAVAASLLGGQLNALTSPTELWPDSDVVPHFPWTMQGALAYPKTYAARLVTVYDDDGSILS